jgi:hypothetical protein
MRSRFSGMIALPGKTWRKAMQAEEFETRLRQDLPRGQAAQAKSAGRERGLFARWLTPALRLRPQCEPR